MDTKITIKCRDITGVKQNMNEENEKKELRGNTTYKYYHEELVLLALSKADIPMQRKELVSATGMKRTTIYDTLQRLQLKKLVEIIYEKGPTKGRPRTYYKERI